MDRIFYLAQIFDGLNTLFIILLIAATSVGIAGLITSLFAIAEEQDKFAEIGLKISKWSGILAVIFALGLIFIPTKQTYLFMVGGRVIEQIVDDNPEIKELPGNTIELLNEYIKEETEEIRAKKLKCK